MENRPRSICLHLELLFRATFLRIVLTPPQWCVCTVCIPVLYPRADLPGQFFFSFLLFCFRVPIPPVSTVLHSSGVYLSWTSAKIWSYVYAL